MCQDFQAQPSAYIIPQSSNANAVFLICFQKLQRKHCEFTVKLECRGHSHSPIQYCTQSLLMYFIRKVML